MTLKLLQLNINGDNYWEQLIPFLKTHDFDILQLQELTGKDTQTGIVTSRFDVYEKLHNTLQETYNGALAIAQRYTSSPNSYMGDATFYKKSLSFIDKKEITISSDGKPFPSDSISYEGVGRKALHLTFEIENKQLSCINTHLAWAKTSVERPHQTKQAEILLQYVKTLPSPFIITGDFNLNPEQPTIQKINKLARNLVSENNVTNTLNPRKHRAKHLFPKGVAVDYIYVSEDITVKNFEVIEEDISDHLGLIAEIEI